MPWMPCKDCESCLYQYCDADDYPCSECCKGTETADMWVSARMEGKDDE